MKNSKKFIAVVLMVGILCTIFAACAKTNDKPSPSTAAQRTNDSTDKKDETKPNPADSYPNKPIEVIIPVAPGGGTDLSGRITASYLEKELGKNFVIVNIGGAGGSVGMTEAKNSTADGYKLLYQQSDMIANDIMGVVDYKWDEAFDIAGTVNLINTMSLLVAGDAPYSNLQEFIDYCKKENRPLNLATEMGTDNQLFMMLFAEKAGIKLNMVDLGGAANRVAAMKGKQIDVTCMPYFNVRDYIAKGDFKCIGMFSNERSQFFKDVPTMKEQGLDIVYNKFHLFAFPAGTPVEIREKFTAALKKVCENPDYQKEVEEKLAFEVMFKGGDDAVKFMKEIEEKYIPIAESLKK